LQEHPLLAAYFLGVGAHGALQGQGGIAGPQGVIFMGDGSTKQGHNAVAEYLVDGALEASLADRAVEEAAAAAAPTVYR
jgi:hypothetical protein